MCSKQEEEKNSEEECGEVKKLYPKPLCADAWY